MPKNQDLKKKKKSGIKVKKGKLQGNVRKVFISKSSGLLSLITASEYFSRIGNTKQLLEGGLIYTRYIFVCCACHVLPLIPYVLVNGIIFCLLYLKHAVPVFISSLQQSTTQKFPEPDMVILFIA